MKKTLLCTLTAIAATILAGGAMAGGFADFYRQGQLRLLSALDDTLARQAQSALTDNFSAVKKADIYLQTKLGGRKGQLGAHIIGAFAEDDGSAFGWQLRGYAAEQSAKGANVGLFARAAKGEFMFGGNVFADYEDGKHGDFLRYGTGAEMQTQYFKAGANYYVPTTKDRTKDQTTAFSRRGYDANLLINIPRAAYMRMRADYYHFDGKHGKKEEKGFRYGMEINPLAGLNVGVYYDDGGESFGGDIAYTYTIGESPVRYNSGNNFFAPDLFAPVSREYAQRIATLASGGE